MAASSEQSAPRVGVGVIVVRDGLVLAAKQLLADGFNQEELSALSRSVPRLFWLHKEWIPPLEPAKTGSGFTEPAWFQRLEPLESNVSAAAEKLRVIGEY